MGLRQIPTGHDEEIQTDTATNHSEIAARTRDAVASAPARYIAAYRAQFGHILNADNASELFPEYAESPNTRATRVRVVRGAAGKVVELVYAELLGARVGVGRLPLVVFTSGGNGAGKSTSVAPDGPEHIVFDSTLSQCGPSVPHIEAALRAGLHVDIRHLARDPEEAWLAVMHRAMNEGQGRTVTLAGHIQTHAGARATFLRLVEHYASNARVSVLVWENGTRGLRRRPIAWLRRRAYPNGDVLRLRLCAALERARRRREITESVYIGCKGDA